MGAEARLSAEDRKEAIRWRFYKADKLFNLAALFIRRLPYIVGIVCAYWSIRVLAGHRTNANIVVSFLASIGRVSVIPWLTSGGFWMWALFERFLRRKNIKRLGARIQVLEKKLDPNRTSSDLGSDGENNPEDSR